jgi:hypothetical protein
LLGRFESLYTPVLALVTQPVGGWEVRLLTWKQGDPLSWGTGLEVGMCSAFLDTRILIMELGQDRKVLGHSEVAFPVH